MSDREIRIYKYQQYDAVKEEEWEITINKTQIYHKNARYFVMKSIDLKSIEISIEHGVWSTTVGPTRRLTDAFKFRPLCPVYLIFSVNESGGYQGFAKLTGLPSSKLKPNLFLRDANSIAYEENFPVKWQTRLMLYPFRNLNYFPLNPLNEDKTIM